LEEKYTQKLKQRGGRMAKKFRVTVDGETFEVIVEEMGESKTPQVKEVKEVKREVPTVPVSTPQPTQPVKKETKKVKVAEGVKVVTAPLPGKVLTVNVSPGKAVKKGDVLLVIEAMKMENEIFAAEDGVVKAVHVSTGQNVETGDPMVEIEVGG